MPKLNPDPCFCGGATVADKRVGWTAVRCVEPRPEWPHVKGCGLRFELWEDRDTVVQKWNKLRSGQQENNANP